MENGGGRLTRRCLNQIFSRRNGTSREKRGVPGRGRKQIKTMFRIFSAQKGRSGWPEEEQWDEEAAVAWVCGGCGECGPKGLALSPPVPGGTKCLSLKPSWWERDISQSTIWAQGMFSKEVKATTREEKGTGGVSLSIDFACNLLLKTAFSLVTLFKTF